MEMKVLINEGSLAVSVYEYGSAEDSENPNTFPLKEKCQLVIFATE